MSLSIRLLAILFLVANITVSCAGKKSSAVIPLQTKDAELNCKEILTEMREAEEYKNIAEKNKELKVSTFLAPLGYMYTLTKRC